VYGKSFINQKIRASSTLHDKSGDGGEEEEELA
jgi:hypothetical protein